MTSSPSSTAPAAAEAAGFDTDVLICGAGAAGLVLAIDLARRGARFRLVDQLPAPFHGSRGKGIQPRTLEVFEDLGVVDRMMAAGGPYPLQREHAADGSFTESPLMEAAPATPAEPYRTPLMLPQFRTEAILRERLAELGHAPHFGRTLTGFEQDAQGVSARITGPQGEAGCRARFLVGSDGGRSFVRHALGIGFPGKTLGVRAVVADVVLTGLDRSAWHRFNEGDMAAQLSLCPLAGTDLFQLQAPIPAEGEPDLSAQGLAAFVAARSGRSDITVHSVAWASAFGMNARLADRYRLGRVLLAGDAAHVHPPTGGQGLNTSVQDAYNLGWKLAAVLAGAPDALLDSYEAERRPVAAEMLGLATKLLDAAKRGDMRRGRETQQLDIGYPASPLSLEAPAREGGLLAGDRAPDAPLAGAAGQTRRLFDLLNGPHWTLLAWQADREAVPARPGLRVHAIGPAHGADNGPSELRDTHGHFQAAYALTAGDRVLIRPDGYVRAIVGAGELAALEACLRDVGLAAGPGYEGDKNAA